MASKGVNVVALSNKVVPVKLKPRLAFKLASKLTSKLSLSISFSWKTLAMSIKALRDPKTKAKTPIIEITTFFKATQFPGPNPISQYVTVSMKTGIKSPRIEKQKAPNNPINGAIVGTATASKTAMTKIYLICQRACKILKLII